MNKSLKRFTPYPVFILAILLLSSNPILAQKQQKKIITTALNRQLKPLPNEKHSFAVEERWLENGQWKARTTYTESGSLMAEYGYADSTRNTLHGKYTLYGTNRKKRKEITYNQGLIDGSFAEWLGDGTLIRKGNQTGETVWGNIELYYGDGTLKASFFTNEQGAGRGMEYFKKAGVTGEGAVINSRQDGAWIYRDSTGKKVLEVTYNEKGIEKEVCFDEDGKEISGKECISDRPATFPGGEIAWRTFL